METMMAAGNDGGGKISRDLQQQNQNQQQAAGACGGHYFQMPLHYPRYRREEYEAMPECQLDRLLSEYGLPVAGTVHNKRTFAIGAFLWGAGGGAASSTGGNN